MAPTRRACPSGLSLRNLGGFGAQGEGKYMMNKYLRERGDANIKSNADLISKATFYQDPNFPDRKQMRENTERQRGARHRRCGCRAASRCRSIVLQCMQEQRLDALVAPTASIPPPKLNGPREPNVNGRSPVGWSLLGQQGFPVITVPAGFTTEVWDRVREGSGHASGRTDSRPGCRSASTSSAVRSTNRCCSASRRRTKRRPDTARRRPISDRWRGNRRRHELHEAQARAQSESLQSPEPGARLH